MKQVHYVDNLLALKVCCYPIFVNGKYKDFRCMMSVLHVEVQAHLKACC